MRCSQVVGPSRSEVIDAPDPSPGPGELLVRVTACGVCVSDRGVWGQPPVTEPLRLGHEVSGVVAAVGPGTYGWSVGERLTGMGGPGYADLVVMEAGNLLPLPAGVRDEEALGEPLACQGEAFARTPFRAHDRVAVVGLGYMGLGFLQLAHLTDPSALIGVDLIEGRRNLALALGATESYHPDQVPGGYRSSANTTFPLDGRCNVVVEATGSAKGLALASELAAPDGTLVVLGYHASGPLNLDLSLWYRSVTIVNGYSDNRARRLDAMSRGLELIAQRRITFAPLITHRFSLNEVDAAFRLFEERPAGFLKAVIVP